MKYLLEQDTLLVVRCSDCKQDVLVVRDGDNGRYVSVDPDPVLTLTTQTSKYVIDAVGTATRVASMLPVYEGHDTTCVARRPSDRVKARTESGVGDGLRSAQEPRTGDAMSDREPDGRTSAVSSTFGHNFDKHHGSRNNG